MMTCVGNYIRVIVVLSMGLIVYPISICYVEGNAFPAASVFLVGSKSINVPLSNQSRITTSTVCPSPFYVSTRPTVAAGTFFFSSPESPPPISSILSLGSKNKCKRKRALDLMKSHSTSSMTFKLFARLVMSSTHSFPNSQFPTHDDARLTQYSECKLLWQEVPECRVKFSGVSREYMHSRQCFT